MRANRPIGLISRDYIPIECIQNCETLFRSTCFGKSGGISSLPADCRRYADQLCVELNNRFKHRIQPPECTSLRHFETDTAVTDLGLGTHQTLSHSFG